MEELGHAMSTHEEIRYPAMRREVLDTLRNLSDPGYQQRVWIDRQFPSPNYYDDFDMVIHTLYDDTTLVDDIGSAIGVILKDEKEARLIGAVIEALEEVFLEGERYADFEVLRACPSWPKVMATAAAAWEVMSANPQQGSPRS